MKQTDGTREENNMSSIALSKTRGSKSGFTLVELLVVIAIIGILIGLLLPAVQAAREAARRTQCTNNLKQIALALLNYQDTNGAFPAGLTITGSRTYNSWMVRVMPFIEMGTAADVWKFSEGYSGPPAGPGGVYVNTPILRTNFSGFVCPSDNPEPWPEPASYSRANYVVCFSPSGTMVEPGANFSFDSCNDSAGTNPSAGEITRRKSLFNVNVFRELREVTDGLSNTIAVSELIAGVQGGTRNDVRGAWWHPFSMGYTHHRTPNTSIPDSAYPGSDYCNSMPPDAPCTPSSPCWSTIDNAARSKHPGGVVAARADGSVAFFTNDVSLAVWQALGSIDGGETF
jgi:prepilin-type N-terminal cleavage/methylation domain-containing protein